MYTMNREVLIRIVCREKVNYLAIQVRETLRYVSREEG
jgi:hypothetical protein